MFPITFSIPECKICEKIYSKEKFIADIIPGNISTYKFTNENDYYEDYKKSVFGKTCKKGGWDCLRHYEILANGCIPYFENLNYCPSKTLHNFPKQIILDAMNKIKNFENKSLIDTYSNLLLEYTKNNLTTKHIANYILETTNNLNVKNILFLNSSVYPDYLRCLTLHGFKILFGKNCDEYPCVPHLYTDFPDNLVYKLYGKGMTYSKLLDKDTYKNMSIEKIIDCNKSVNYESSFLRNKEYDEQIIQNILNKKYDLIIYGSLMRETIFFEYVKNIYDKNKVIFLCGEDPNINEDKNILNKVNIMVNDGYKVFIREL